MDTVFTAVFTGYKSLYLLHNSFILDSRATTHICNNRQQFKDFVTALEILLIGDSYIHVEGYGTVQINLTRPLGKVNIKLAQVAFIPTFQTNTVSYHHLLKKDIHWDTQQGILTLGGKLWCQLIDMYEQFVVEYQPAAAAFPADSRALRLALHGTIERWHQ